jgi:hypothetical protein
MNSKDVTQNPEEPDEWDIGIAWYRREQWPRLLEVVVDSNRLHKTYDEWLEFTNNLVSTIMSNGHTVTKIDVAVNELVAWCKQWGRPIDSDACLDFISHGPGKGPYRGPVK